MYLFQGMCEKDSLSIVVRKGRECILWEIRRFGCLLRDIEGKSLLLQLGVELDEERVDRILLGRAIPKLALAL